MAERGYLVSESDKKRLTSVVRAVENATGAVTSTNGGMIVPPRHRRRSGQGLNGSDGAWFRISAAVQDGSNNRWTYSGKRQAKTSAGYGGWTDSTVDTATYTLYSSIEDQNGSSGTYGNGVSQTNLDAINSPDGTFALQAIPAGTRVFARRVTVETTPPTVEWWIPNLPNGVDGECPS